MACGFHGRSHRYVIQPEMNRYFGLLEVCSLGYQLIICNGCDE